MLPVVFTLRLEVKDLVMNAWFHQVTARLSIANIFAVVFLFNLLDASGKLRIWDTTQKEHLLKYEYSPFAGRIKDIAWTEDSRRMAVVGEGREKWVGLNIWGRLYMTVLCFVLKISMRFWILYLKSYITVVIYVFLRCFVPSTIPETKCACFLSCRFGAVFLWDTGSKVGEVAGHSKIINSVDLRPKHAPRMITGSDDTCVSFSEGLPFKFKTTSFVSDFCFFFHTFIYNCFKGCICVYTSSWSHLDFVRAVR